MAKHWETFEHTADLGLQGWADTLAELFEAMGEALSRQICNSPIEHRRTVEIQVNSTDVETLMVDFLTEILNLFNFERFLTGQVRIKEIHSNSLRAELAGESYDENRHELSEEIKAVTYHQLKVAREGDKWVARVILDI